MRKIMVNIYSKREYLIDQLKEINAQIEQLQNSYSMCMNKKIYLEGSLATVNELIAFDEQKKGDNDATN